MLIYCMRNYDISSAPRVALRYDLRQCGVYCITNRENGKFYIGSSKNCYHRVLSQHLPRLRNGEHTNPHLQAAYDKYGEDVFDYFLLEECPEDDLVLVEQEYLDNTRCTDPHVGYNINVQAGVTVLTEEQRRKISLAKMGHEVSPEARKKIGDASKGRRWTSAQRAKFIAANTGKKRTAETRRRMSEAQRRCWLTEERRVSQQRGWDKRRKEVH